MEEINIETRPLAEREKLQAEAGVTTLPYQDLCYATYTTQAGAKLLVDVIGTDETEKLALLSYLDKQHGRGIWVAERDQAGAPGTWLWTPEQLEAARRNPVRIRAEENDFADDGQAASPFEIAPLHPDRRTEILMLGLDLGKSDAEVQERLRTEGFDTTLPAGYRETWEPGAGEARKTEPLQRPRPAKNAIKFSGKRVGKKRR